MTTAIYVRVALDDEQGAVLASQEQLLRTFADKNQLKIDSVFQDVGSGLNFERPGWRGLLAELSTNHYDWVLVKDINRIGRELVPTLRAIKEIEKTGAKLFCINGDHQSIQSTRRTMECLVRQFGK